MPRLTMRIAAEHAVLLRQVMQDAIRALASQPEEA
jgi:hypothetical protein